MLQPSRKTPVFIVVHGLFGLGVGSALFLVSLDFGAVTKVTIPLATTIALILPFALMWAEGVPATGTRPWGIAFGDQYCRC